MRVGDEPTRRPRAINKLGREQEVARPWANKVLLKTLDYYHI